MQWGEGGKILRHFPVRNSKKKKAGNWISLPFSSKRGGTLENKERLYKRVKRRKDSNAAALDFKKRGLSEKERRVKRGTGWRTNLIGNPDSGGRILAETLIRRGQGWTNLLVFRGGGEKGNC